MDVSLLALAHLAFTLAMVGLMTAVQLVIYPAFRRVPQANFVDYVNAHGVAITRPLALFAPAEVVLALLVWIAASGGAAVVAFLSGALLAIAWIATMVFYGPFHGRLTSEPYNPAMIERLITTNWARTTIWWLRGIIAIWLVTQI